MKTYRMKPLVWEPDANPTAARSIIGTFYIRKLKENLFILSLWAENHQLYADDLDSLAAAKLAAERLVRERIEELMEEAK